MNRRDQLAEDEEADNEERLVQSEMKRPAVQQGGAGRWCPAESRPTGRVAARFLNATQ